MVLALVHGQTFDNSIDIHWCGTNKHERAIVVNRHQLRNEKPKYRIPNALVWEYPVLRHKHVSRRLKLSEILPHPIVWDLLTLTVSVVCFVCFVFPLCLVAPVLGTIDPFTPVRRTRDYIGIKSTFPYYVPETKHSHIAVTSAKCCPQLIVANYTK